MTERPAQRLGCLRRAALPRALASAALGLLALVGTGTAAAQSSLRLYGRLDLAVQHYAAPDGGALRLRSGNLSSSQWGLRGVEDLGGGLQLAFILESGFAADTGSTLGDLLFGRRSTVSLSGALGVIEAGRRVTPVADVLYRVEPSGRGSGLGLNDALASAPRGFMRRANRQLRYTTPRWRGVAAQLMYSLGDSNVAVPEARPHVLGLNATYVGERLYLGYARQDARDPARLAEAPSPQAGLITAVTPNRFQTLAASYRLDSVELMGFVAANRRADIRLTPSSPRQPALDQRIQAVGVSVPWGPHSASLQVGRIRDQVERSTGPAHARTFTASYLHALSKRTHLFASYTRIHNENFTTELGGFSALSNDSYDTVLSSSPGAPIMAVSTALSLGLRHMF